MQPSWALPLLLALALVPAAAGVASAQAGEASREKCNIVPPISADQNGAFLCVNGEKDYVGCPIPQCP
ncbi:MAG: hypothetical protein QOG31_1143 [Thermoplasmata archaeon]|jgi:hypothetical protein|nr:hypothetical protein [Thermoplasmata archaeon]